ncbi:MAG: hypothetical protein ACXADX_19670 [Candidatus Hodarchaeales archaeon]|jgi:hypothetical protein
MDGITRKRKPEEQKIPACQVIELKDKNHVVVVQNSVDYIPLSLKQNTTYPEFDKEDGYFGMMITGMVDGHLVYVHRTITSDEREEWRKRRPDKKRKIVFDMLVAKWEDTND